MSEQWFDIIEADTLKAGQHHVKVVEDIAIAVFNLSGEFYAIEDNCPHQSLPLSDGAIDGNEIECPFHGARFCLKTGAVTAPPAFEGLATFETRIHQGMVQVKR